MLGLEQGWAYPLGRGMGRFAGPTQVLSEMRPHIAPPGVGGWDGSVPSTGLNGSCSAFPEDTTADLSGRLRLSRDGLGAIRPGGWGCHPPPPPRAHLQMSIMLYMGEWEENSGTTLLSFACRAS